MIINGVVIENDKGLDQWATLLVLSVVNLVILQIIALKEELQDSKFEKDIKYWKACALMILSKRV